MLSILQMIPLNQISIDLMRKKLFDMARKTAFVYFYYKIHRFLLVDNVWWASSMLAIFYQVGNTNTTATSILVADIGDSFGKLVPDLECWWPT